MNVKNEFSSVAITISTEISGRQLTI